jgi:hypothetical protein
MTGLRGWYEWHTDPGHHEITAERTEKFVEVADELPAMFVATKFRRRTAL